MKRAPKFTDSSGNVFKDLELSQPEEALAKAELTAQIAEIISKKGLTQAAAAKLLGIDQPKVSALLRGRLAGFSTERLIRFLTALGSDVQIVVRTKVRARGRGHLEVVTA
jgi:predicted XRE-type DNA-binding protein